MIGSGNKLPWHLPADLKRFKALTLNHPVIMGRKTFESIGKPLPGRTNIVVTRQKDLKPCGYLVAHSTDEALQLAQDSQEIFAIGGLKIFEAFLPYADKIYLTMIHHDFEGDTRLFTIEEKSWQEVSREDFPADSENRYPYSFLIYERKDG